MRAALDSIRKYQQQVFVLDRRGSNHGVPTIEESCTGMQAFSPTDDAFLSLRERKANLNELMPCRSTAFRRNVHRGFQNPLHRHQADEQDYEHAGNDHKAPFGWVPGVRAIYPW